MFAALLSVVPGCTPSRCDDETELGGDDDLVTAALHGLADHLLAVERAVDLSGVDVGDAEVEGAVDRADGLGVIQGSFAGVGASHGHRAESETGDVKASDPDVLHWFVPFK